jgi:hypothetical protein
MFNELTVLVVYPHFLFQAIAIYLPPPAHPDKMQGLHIGFTSNFHIPVVIILATSQFISDPARVLLGISWKLRIGKIGVGYAKWITRGLSDWYDWIGWRCLHYGTYGLGQVVLFGMVLTTDENVGF